MIEEEHIPWQRLLLGILDDHREQATLQGIYADIEEQYYDMKNEGTELIKPELFKINPRYGNRPKYQHTVRGCLSRYKKCGWVIWIDKAIYRLTDKGKERLRWIQENEK
jgi:DNA-binding transcriptional regulator PaaX